VLKVPLNTNQPTNLALTSEVMQKWRVNKSYVKFVANRLHQTDGLLLSPRLLAEPWRLRELTQM